MMRLRNYGMSFFGIAIAMFVTVAGTYAIVHGNLVAAGIDFALAIFNGFMAIVNASRAGKNEGTDEIMERLRARIEPVIDDIEIPDPLIEVY